jgi:hypothetical protein
MRLSWLIEIANQSSVMPSAAYAPPFIENIARADNGSTSLLPVAGGNTLLISGTNFGAVGPDFISGTLGSVGLYLGGLQVYSLLRCNVTVAHTQISCHMPPGTGEEFSVIVVVLGQPSPAWPTADSLQDLSYAPPTLVSIALANGALPTQGGAVMTLQCTNVGDDPARVRVFVCPGAAFTTTCISISFPNVAITSPDTVVRIPSPPVEATALLGHVYFAVRVGNSPVGVGQDMSRPTSFLNVPVGQPGLLPKMFAGDFVIDLVNSMMPSFCVAMQHGDFLVSLVGVNLGNSMSLASVSMALDDGSLLNCTLCYIEHTVAMCLTPFSNVPVMRTVSVWTGALQTPAVGLSLSSLVIHPSIDGMQLFDPHYGTGKTAVIPTDGGAMLVRGTDFKNSGTLQIVRTSGPPPIAAGPGDPYIVS